MGIYNSSALIIIEINEPKKAPDIRYITVDTSGFQKSDDEFAESAIAYFKNGRNYPTDTTFNLRAVQRFESSDSYIKFLQNQLLDSY